MHEMGEMKRAQELRVDEFSFQKLRESHETTQRLAGNAMQDHMNCMSDSREFQEVESNHGGRSSYVPSQFAMIPCSRSMLSRDRRLPLDSWNTSGSQENVFGCQFSTIDSHRDHPQGIHYSTIPSEDQVRCWANGLTYVVFSKPSNSHEKWQVNFHGAFSISHSTLGIREKDQSCHHEVRMHLALASPRGDLAPKDKHDQRLHLKERSSPCDLDKERSRAHRERSDHSHTS